MKVQENESLKQLAIQANNEHKKLSIEIYDSLEMWELLDGGNDYWGFPIKDCIKDETVIDLILCGLCLKPTQENKETFLSLILMLGGDCPDCGSDLEVDPDKSEYKQIFGDGYSDPQEYEATTTVMLCRHCLYSELR